MNRLSKYFLVLMFIGIVSSCSNYKLNYSPEVKNWASNELPTNLAMKHRVYMIGDAGQAAQNQSTYVLDYLKKQLAKEGNNSSVLFLGNNISPRGMSSKSDEEERAQSEASIDVQLDILKNFKGQPIFIPGESDWGYGIKGLRRQEKYIEKKINKMRGVDDDDSKQWEDYFFPGGGCPGPEVIEVNEQLVIIIVDSQWYLSDWDKEPRMHTDCEVKNRRMYAFNFENAVKKYRTKNVIVALHHPFYSNGPRGGKFTAKDHIFPLTAANDKLYFPLPGVGSIYTFLRGTIGSRQDLSHQQYKNLKHHLLTGVKKNGNYIFVSGHEHNLQYLQNDQQHFIVSGSAAKKSPAALGKGAEFGYGKQGYSTIDFFEDGQAWLQFWIPDADGQSAKVVFRKKIKDKLMIGAEENIPSSFPEFEKREDSVQVNVIQNKLKPVSFFHNLVLGDHYRDVYLEKYKIPTLDLSQAKGGLTPEKRGGGNQTNSLRMLDTTGKQFVLRDLTKDVSRLLPYPFNKMTLAKGVVLDNFLSTHPFAPFAIPKMSKAIGIYHTNPELYYVAKQPQLGTFNDAYGGSVYLLEERPAKNWSGTGVFGDSKKIIGTPDVTELIVRNNKHKVDQPFAVRTRIFDLVLGDWDRHDDQWRWARFEKDGQKIYRPIPRDRDQAFCKYDGLLIQFLHLTVPTMKILRTYDPKVPKPKWVTWSAREFDNSFLNEMAWSDWAKEIKIIQTQLTDEVVDEAFMAWPEKARELSLKEIKSVLKQRRDNLMDIAFRYYKVLSKEVDVYGTDERELFVINRTKDCEVEVEVYELSKKGKRKDRVYKRLFKCDETKAINVYGIGDDDQFEVEGEVNKSIKVRLIGGQGKDLFIDKSKVKGPRRMTKVIDDKRKNKLELGTEAADKRTDRRNVNLYDRKAAQYNYDFLFALPIVGSNPDDGFTIGATALWTDYGFKKNPFAATHAFASSFSFGTKAYYLEYTGDYLEVLGKWDIYLEAILKAPSFAFNYFGFGNESIADIGNNGIDFYRVRQGLVHINPSFKKRFAAESGFFTVGPLFEMSNIERTAGRFISGDDLNFSDQAFENRYFAGAKMGFFYNNLDNWVIPHKGISFNSTLNWLNNLNDEGYTLGQLNADLSFYQSLDRKENIVFATRFGVGHNFGDEFEFFQAQFLGAEMLRGYRAQRFYGKTSFWQNVDLRARLFNSVNKVIPFTFGLFAGFDHGRVWVKNDSSDNWHYNYGGGIWIAPADVVVLTLGVFQTKENEENGPRVSFQLGMSF